ncbi:transcription factor IIIB 50 kDa subunit isoform X2 [Clupea harengus]|uniref:Transcription factor IIIB 50 kDa subunit n=1 Tax=Clupea harengus TaxID=7950 RepID=A0A6P8GE14_CLUHA|nr:transcription factor IIIB 50 kDa subunit isoform X2 [Clupea harengus]
MGYFVASRDENAYSVETKERVQVGTKRRRMPHTCAECGSTNVVEDELYSERTLVCEDCGSVVTREHLTTTRSEEEQSTAVPYYASTEVTKQPCRNLIKCMKRVRALCRIFRFPGDMESRTVELYQQAYGHPTFLQVRLSKKELLAGACMVAVARMNNWPIAMGTIGSLLEADSTLMGAVYQDLIKSLHLQATSSSITDLLESYCHGLNLTAKVVGEEYGETAERLTERATALVELAGDTWLVTGRHPLRISLAAVYLAWQSLRPASRMKVSLAVFCRIAKLTEGKVPGSQVVQVRVKELREVLCKLGAQLPWLRGARVEPGRVAALVEDIVKHRRLLLAMAMKSHEEDLQANAINNEMATSDDTSAPVEITPTAAENVLVPGNMPGAADNTPTRHNMPTLPENTQTGDMAVTSENTLTRDNVPAASCSTHTPAQVHPPVSGRALPKVHLPEDRPEDRKPVGVRRRAGEMTCIMTTGVEEMDTLGEHGLKVEEDGSSLAGQDSWSADLPEDHWGKRQLFVPPCLRLAKRPRTERGPDVTGDEEISDSEIESYIRTPKEVRDFLTTQRWIAEEQEMEKMEKKS